jgi:hypothetical protein
MVAAKRLCWTAVLTAIFLAPDVIVSLALFSPISLPDLALVPTLERGMTETELVALFGARPTDQPWQAAGLATYPANLGAPTYWPCDASVAILFFDDDGRVNNWTNPTGCG